MRNNNLPKGIFFLILSALSFATMSLFVRLAGDLPSIQKSLFRNLVALVFAFCVIMKEGGNFSFDKKNLKFLLIRSLFGTFGIFFNFYAIEHLMLADASMLAKLSPFFVTIFSYFILKEKIKPWQGISIAIAFVGSIFIVNPEMIVSFFTGVAHQSSLGNVASIAAILGALSAGVAYTMIRLLSIRGERGSFIVFFFSAFSTLVCLPFVLFDYAPMSMEQVFLLLLAGLFASFGQFSVTAAYANAPAKDISIYDYTQIIFSTVYGYFVFQQVPSPYSIIGYVIIIAVAFYIFFKGKQGAHKEKNE